MENFSVPAGLIFLIMANDGNVFLSNSTINNLNLNTANIIISMNALSCCKRSLVIEKCTFRNINQSSTTQYPAILIKDSFTNFSVSESVFNRIITCKEKFNSHF
jgi:hypothetical protein